ncbi:hypothetical protein B7494_g4417 [Chlorociboria aeruginascens]|nr:hypothetical protein B7494_g4417 [Chlorociboria aeruginascens]
MSGRAPRKSFRCHEYLFKHVTRPQHAQQRTFATSTTRNKGVPKFTETSSPELDELLSKFRYKTFLPSYLPKALKDMIYKTKHIKSLETEPVKAYVGDEEFVLEHIDRTQDLPAVGKGIRHAVTLMENKKDWDNLKPLLKGLKHCKMRILPSDTCFAISQAASKGRLDVILDCARGVSETGFFLKDLAVVARLMWSIQNKAFVSDWNKKETTQALTWAEMVSSMLEDKKHAGGSLVKWDIRRCPEVIGILLQLSSVRASRHLDGTDEEGKVASYATRLMDNPVQIRSWDTVDLEEPYESRKWIYQALPILHGMKIAQTILDPTSETSKLLLEKTLELEKTISERFATLPQNTPNTDRLRTYRDKLGL